MRLDTTSRSSDQQNTKHYTFPSLGRVVLTFFLVGPSLWPFAVLFVSLLRLDFAPSIPDPFAVIFGVPTAALFGAVSWWWATSYSNMWLGTWIPTLLAALLYWLAMASNSKREYLVFRTRRSWILTNVLVSALISGLVFFAVVGLAVFFNAEIQAFQGNLQGSTSPKSWTAFATWVAVVSVIGAALGVTVSFFSREVSCLSRADSS